MIAPWEYFTDSILRAPTLGCMMMCMSAAIVGVIAFLKKQSLLGESLAHASFPGVVLGVIAAGTLAEGNETWAWIPSIVMAGAFLSSLAGMLMIHYLEKRHKIRADSALCFILSVAFGIGVTLASRVQFTHTGLYKQSLGYLYGQAATMTDIHVLIYGILCAVVIAAVVLFYKELQALVFDRDYAKSLGIKVALVDALVLVLITLSIVIGIRSVGVVLISGMLIAPAAAARQFTHKLSVMMGLAAAFGLISGYGGIVLSVELTNAFSQPGSGARLAFPTGPMIVLVATALCLLALLFAPERGLMTRFARVTIFRYRCIGENLLKAMWRQGPDSSMTFHQISGFHTASMPYLRLVLMRLIHSGWLEKGGRGEYRLTEDGKHRAAHIVRLHRLWELYLADQLGIGAEKVHRSAEEIEHIITPELEKMLTQLLQDPKYDPHHQPIPPHER